MNRTRRLLALSLTTALAVTSISMPAVAQSTGSLAGKATDEAKQPYSNYSIRATRGRGQGQGQTVPLGPDGRFAITGLTFPGNYMIDLINNQDNTVVCTEGPFKNAKTDINIDCGKVPAALWLSTLAAGTVSTIGVVSQSNPR